MILRGLGRLLQAGSPGSARRSTRGLGFLAVFGVLLFVSLADGSGGGGLTWRFSKKMVQAVPGILVVGGCLAWHDRSKRVRPDANGMVLVPKADADANGMVLLKQYIQSLAQPDDQLIPRSATHVQIMERRPEPPAPPQVNAGGPLRIPPLLRLLEIESEKPQIYVPGVSAQGPIVLDYEKSGPFTVTGLQGTFKTELLVQACMHALWRGMRVVLIDPDAGHPQSLTNRLGPLADERILGYPMGTDEASCRMVMQMLYAEAHEAADQNLPIPPTFVAMDEANATATLTSKETKEAFVKLTKLMVLKLRKRIVTMGMAIQNPTEKNTGNDGLLQTFGFAMSGRVEPRMRGRAMRQANEAVPEEIGMLPLDGTFFIFNPMAGEIVKMHIPFSTPADLHAVYEKCMARLQVSATRVLNGHTPEALVTTAPQQIVQANGSLLELVEDVDIEPGETPQKPLAKMKDLHEKGLTPKEIIVECYGGYGKRWVANPGREYSKKRKLIVEATKGCTCGDAMHKETEG